MSRKALLTVAVAVVLVLSVDSAAAMNFDWWNSSWHYRINVTVNTTSYDRTDWPVEYRINFSTLGIGTFDNNSIRIIEYWENGTVRDAGTDGNGVPSQFDELSGYHATNNAVGDLVWIMNGNRTANTNYYYFVYFDKSAYAKQAVNYSTQLNFYNNTGTEFWVNNSKLAVKVDTGVTRINKTAGMYYARFRENDTLLFDAPSSQLPIEYIVYQDGVNKFYTYDFRNNFRLVVDGPVKKVIEMQGNEVTWGNVPVATGEGVMVKRYTFYENNKWVIIDQNFTSTKVGSSIGRDTGRKTAPALDVGRTEIQPDNFQYDGDSSDPYSWYSVVNDTLHNGLGIINLNETVPFGSEGYKANYDTDLKRIGLDLSPVTLNPGESILETAAVIFNDEGAHTAVTNLLDRLAGNVVPTKWPLEAWKLEVRAQSDYNDYNRNETIFLTGNITTDTHAQNYSTNATLTSPSGTNTSFDLYKNGSLYVNNYTFPTTAQPGSWLVTIRVYDSLSQLLNISSKHINVTDVYKMVIRFKDDYYTGLVNQTTFYANVTATNYRNDTGISGAFYCEYNTTPVTVIDNVTYLGGGIYSINFSAPQVVGVYNLTCNLTKDENIGFGSVLFTTYLAENTTVDTRITSANSTIAGITQAQNQSFEVLVNVTNTGFGMAYSINISLSLPPGWTPNVTLPRGIGNLIPNSDSHLENFKINVPNATSPGNYTIGATATWRNEDDTINISTGEWSIEVLSNPLLNITQENVSQNVWEGTLVNIGNFTIYAYGNDKLTNVNISCDSGEVCQNFTVTFSPNFISEIPAGSSVNVSVNVSVPEGYWPRNNSAGIVKAKALDLNNIWDTTVLYITVPQSKTWARTPGNCSKVVPVNKTGDVCEVGINNTGNVPLDFNVTSYGNGTIYTSTNVTNFSVQKTTYYKIKVIYNTSSATNTTYLTNFTLAATNADASPADQNITVTLEAELGPSVVMNVSPTEVYQYDNITITANLTDRIGEGIRWVKANITKPDGKVETVNLSNTTSNPPLRWSNSSWYGVFTNTSLRGPNYTVIVYSEDVAGGYTVTSNKSFTVYAKLMLDVYTGKQVYAPGKSGTFNIKALDALGAPIAGVNVTINIRDANGTQASFQWDKSKLTDSNGIAYSYFTLPDDIGGFYYWESNATYYDSYEGNHSKWLYATDAGAFFVGALSVSTSAGDLYMPGDKVTVLTTVMLNNEPSTADNVTITINLNGTDIAVLNATLISGPAYIAEFPLGTNATPGTYVARATVYYNSIYTYNIDLFTVSTGIGNLVLEVDPGGPYRPGDTMAVKASVKDEGNNHLQGANITLWIKDINGSVVKTTNVSNVTSPLYLPDIQLDSNMTPGHYTAHAEAKYGLYTATDTKLFDIYKSLFAKIGIQPIIYLSSNFNATMKMSVMVLDPETGTGIDPDEVNLNIYYTENSTLTLWRTLQKSNLTYGSDGILTYSENLTSNTSAGAYLALLEVKEGTVRAWSMETFRISSGIFDIQFESVTTPIPSGSDLGFTIRLTYFGEATARDVVLDYWIDGTGYTGYRESFANPDPETPVSISRTIPGVTLDDGSYVLKASITYDPANPPSTAQITFEIGGNVTRRGVVGGGGGGGAIEEVAEEVEHPLVILDIYPTEVHVEKGGSAYLVGTVNNTGARLFNVIASIEGVPSDWYDMIKGQADVLETGQILSVLAEIKVPINGSVIPYPVKLKVSSGEISDEKSFLIRVFESKYDLVVFEIDAAKERIRTVERRIFKAIGEGKNVSSGMEILDQATAEVWKAEGFLKEGKYPEALRVLEDAMRMLDKISEIIDKAKLPEVVKEAPPTVTPEAKPVISTELLTLMVVILIAAIALIAVIAYWAKKWSQSFESFAERTVVRLGPPRRVREAAPAPPSIVIPRPTVAKPGVSTEVKTMTAEAPDPVAELRSERNRVRKMLDTLKDQYTKGVISQKTYNELKTRNEEKLANLDDRIKKGG